MTSGGHGKKLTNEEVKEIRLFYLKGGWTCRDLADKYGVSRTTISNIVSFKFYNTREAQIGSTR